MSTYKIDIGGHTHTIKITKLEGSKAHLEVDEKPLTIAFEKEADATATEILSTADPNPAVAPDPPLTSTPTVTKASPSTGGVPVVAPIPGLVIDIKVKPGDMVEPNQILMVMEAMKMENPIKSPAKGTVKEILVQVGVGVATGDVLMVLD